MGIEPNGANRHYISKGGEAIVRAWKVEDPA